MVSIVSLARPSQQCTSEESADHEYAHPLIDQSHCATTSTNTKRMSLLRLAVLTCVLTRLDAKIEIVDFPRLYDHRCGNQFPASGGPFVEDRVKIIALNRSASVVVCHEPRQ
jgi:hypothetical protein